MRMHRVRHSLTCGAPAASVHPNALPPRIGIICIADTEITDQSQRTNRRQRLVVFAWLVYPSCRELHVDLRNVLTACPDAGVKALFRYDLRSQRDFPPDVITNVDKNQPGTTRH